MLTHKLKIKSPYLALAVGIATTATHISCCLCQLQAGVYDFGQGRQGEKRGSWTPGEWLAAILLVMTILLGLALAFGLCYYVNKRQRQRQPTSATNYRRQQNLEISFRQPHGPVGGVSSGSSKFVGLPAAADNRRQLPIRQNDNTRQQQQAQRTPNDSLIVQI